MPAKSKKSWADVSHDSDDSDTAVNVVVNDKKDVMDQIREMTINVVQSCNTLNSIVNSYVDDVSSLSDDKQAMTALHDIGKAMQDASVHVNAAIDENELSIKNIQTKFDDRVSAFNDFMDTVRLKKVTPKVPVVSDKKNVPKSYASVAVPPGMRKVQQTTVIDNINYPILDNVPNQIAASRDGVIVITINNKQFTMSNAVISQTRQRTRSDISERCGHHTSHQPCRSDECSRWYHDPSINATMYDINPTKRVFTRHHVARLLDIVNEGIGDNDDYDAISRDQLQLAGLLVKSAMEIINRM